MGIPIWQGIVHLLLERPGTMAAYVFGMVASGQVVVANVRCL